MKKKYFCSLFTLLLVSCTPIIFYYKPMKNDYIKKDDYYFFLEDSIEIGISPRIWIHPRSGLECNIKLKNYGSKFNFCSQNISIRDKRGEKIDLVICNNLPYEKFIKSNREVHFTFRHNCKGRTVKKKLVLNCDTINIKSISMT